MRVSLLGSLVVGLVVLSLAPAAGQQPETIYAPGDGVSLPRVLTEVHAEYTAGARKARIQGTVVLTCVVSRDGKTRDVAVTQPLHEELDAKAAEALGKWLFEPGKKDGTPVPVRVSVEMTFTLK